MQVIKVGTSSLIRLDKKVFNIGAVAMLCEAVNNLKDQGNIIPISRSLSYLRQISCQKSLRTFLTSAKSPNLSHVTLQWVEKETLEIINSTSCSLLRKSCPLAIQACLVHKIESMHGWFLPSFSPYTSWPKKGPENFRLNSLNINFSLSYHWTCKLAYHISFWSSCIKQSFFTRKLGTLFLIIHGPHTKWTPYYSRHQHWSEQIQSRNRAGHKVVIVSSGAVGVGCQRLGLNSRPSELSKRQALAAAGQIHLMKYYDDFFTAIGIVSPFCIQNFNAFLLFEIIGILQICSQRIKEIVNIEFV